MDIAVEETENLKVPDAFADPWDTHSDKPQTVQRRIGAWLARVAANYEVPIVPLGELRGYILI